MEAKEKQIAESILLGTMRCTIEEDVEDVNENYYFKWNDVLKVMEQYASQLEPERTEKLPNQK